MKKKFFQLKKKRKENKNESENIKISEINKDEINRIIDLFKRYDTNIKYDNYKTKKMDIELN